jgi:hypothetical protein
MRVPVRAHVVAAAAAADRGGTGTQVVSMDVTRSQPASHGFLGD